jgi:hypothetical protein
MPFGYRVTLQLPHHSNYFFHFCVCIYVCISFLTPLTSSDSQSLIFSTHHSLSFFHSSLCHCILDSFHPSTSRSSSLSSSWWPLQQTSFTFPNLIIKYTSIVLLHPWKLDSRSQGFITGRSVGTFLFTICEKWPNLLLIT